MVLSSFFFFFSSRRRHTRLTCDWSSDVCSSDLPAFTAATKSGTSASQASMVLRETSSRRARSLSVAPSMQNLRASSLWVGRSEERRVGKECSSRWSPYHEERKRGGRGEDRAR